MSRPPAVVPNAGLRGGCGARKRGQGFAPALFLSVGRPAVSDNVQAECLSAKSTVSASARCDARMCFGMPSEKRFLPAHLNPTAALPALHTGTAGGCEISFAGNARVGKRSGSVKRRNALLCVRNTSGTAGGGRARAYSPAPVRRHTVGDREAAIRRAFCLRAVSASVCAAFRLALEGKLFFRSALFLAAAPPYAPPSAGGQPSSPRHGRSFNAAPLSPADGGAAVRAGKSP